MPLLDTSVLFDVLCGHGPACRWLGGLMEVPACSELTRAELLSAVRSTERVRAERLLDALRWVPVDESMSRRAGELGGHYRQSHPWLGMVDFVIAASAQLTEAELATGNPDRYPMFAGLAPPYLG